jgi:hypothetical protein
VKLRRDYKTECRDNDHLRRARSGFQACMEISIGRNFYSPRRTSRALPPRSECHFTFILLLDTRSAQVVWAIIWASELDETSSFRIASGTVRRRQIFDWSVGFVGHFMPPVGTESVSFLTSRETSESNQHLPKRLCTFRKNYLFSFTTRWALSTVVVLITL